MPASELNRRSFFRQMGGLSAAALLASDAVAAAEPTESRQVKRPNFLVLFADDQNFRTIHALNNAEVRTPALDGLAQRGTAFTHCFHQGSWTGAVCVASRAMMLTGRYLWNCGGDRCGYFPLLGEALQMGGYDTYGVGKWHNGDQTALRSFVTGKTIGPGFYASTPEDGAAYDRPRPGNDWTPWDPKFRGHWTPTELWDIEHPSEDALTTVSHGPSSPRAGKRYEKDQHSCELYADTAIELLRQMPSKPDRPFLMYVAWNSPHDPRQAPKEIVDMYPADKIQVPPNFLPRHPFDQGDADVRDEKLAPFPRTPEEIQVHLREYYASITFLDRQIGRILEALEKTGLADNTHVVITGDHGLAVGEHGLMGKQNLYDCSVRMPFIIAGPGIPAGRRIDAMIYQHSLFPTLCDLAGTPIPATVQFPSLVPLLHGGQDRLFDSVYCAYKEFQRSARTDRHKMILYPQARQAQLFDLAHDPWEKDNLMGQAQYAETATQLFRALTQWQKTVNDPLVLDPGMFGIQV